MESHVDGVEAPGAQPSPDISPDFVTRAAKRKYPLGLSGIGRRRRSFATSRSTICDKHGGTQQKAGEICGLASRW